MACRQAGSRTWSTRQLCRRSSASCCALAAASASSRRALARACDRFRSMDRNLVCKQVCVDLLASLYVYVCAHVRACGRNAREHTHDNLCISSWCTGCSRAARCCRLHITIIHMYLFMHHSQDSFTQHASQAHRHTILGIHIRTQACTCT